MAKVIAIVNQKGGVGKTTTSVNLSTAFAAVGQDTLVIDTDPLGNCSTSFGIDAAMRQVNAYDVLVNDIEISKSICNTKIPHLSIIPATVDLAAAEVELTRFQKREYILQSKLKALRDKFDYIFIDCPPSLGLLTINALIAADSVMIPMQCEFFALEGLSHLIKTLNLVKRNLNPRLEVEGIILTMYDRRNRLSEQVEYDIRDHFQEKVYKTVIPRNVRLSEAPSYGKPAIIYDLKCSGSQAYIKLAREILIRHAEKGKKYNIKKEMVKT